MDVATMVAVGSVGLHDVRDTVTTLLRDPGERKAFFTRVGELAAEV